MPMENNKELIIPGLVLEGGAMRGMYTAGVLDTFMDLNIKANSIVGVSAGALFGVNFLSNQKGRAIRYNKRFNKDRKYMGLIPLLKEGNIVSTEYAYERVPHILDPFDNNTYMQNKSEFYAVITDINTGKGEYIKIKSVFEQMDTLRASGSMPFVSRPVVIDGNEYLDGAIADNIPFEWMKNKINDKIVVILTRDIEYRKKPMKKMFYKKYMKKYPIFASMIANRHNVYNKQVEQLKEWEKEGNAFVIRPSMEVKIGRTERNPNKLQAVYDLGVKDALECYERLKEYLK